MFKMVITCSDVECNFIKTNVSKIVSVYQAIDAVELRWNDYVLHFLMHQEI